MDPTIREKIFFVCELKELKLTWATHFWNPSNHTTFLLSSLFLGGLYKLSSSPFLHSILTDINNLFFQDILNICMCGNFQGEDETYPDQTLIWFSLFFCYWSLFLKITTKKILLKCFLTCPDFILPYSAKHVISDTNISNAFTASIPQKSSVSSESGELYLTLAL